MNTYTWQDAWVLLAVKYAQGEHGSASRSEVLKAADFINHAQLLEQELTHAIRVLGEANLVRVEGDDFSLGPAFAELWARSGAGRHRNVRHQREKIQQALGIR